MSGQGPKLQHITVSFLITFIIFIVEILIWKEAFSENISAGTALGIHILITGLCLLLLFIGWGGRYTYLMTLLIALMGPFGAGMGLLVLSLYIVDFYFVDPVTNLIRELMPKLKKSKRETLYDRIQSGLETSEVDVTVTPLTDIIELGNRKQKLVAIEKVLQYYRPEFIPALKMALKDEDNSVRVLAATVISSLEDNFHKDYLHLEEKCRSLPNDPKTTLKFAKHCYNYAQFDVFEEGRLRSIREIAIEKYQEYLKLCPEDLSVMYQLGSLYFDNGDYDKAEMALESLTKQSKTFTQKVYLKLMDIYFHRKMFRKMHALTNENYSYLTSLISDEGDPKYEDILFSWGTIDLTSNVDEVANARS